jgi:hypothetical protein
MIRRRGPMGPSRKRGVDGSDPDDQEIREQEFFWRPGNSRRIFAADAQSVRRELH